MQLTDGRVVGDLDEAEARFRGGAGAVAPADDLDGHGADRALVGDNVASRASVGVGVGAGLQLDEQQIVGLAGTRRRARPGGGAARARARRGSCRTTPAGIGPGVVAQGQRAEGEQQFRRPRARRAAAGVEPLGGVVEVRLVVADRAATGVQHLAPEARHVDDERGVGEAVPLDDERRGRGTPRPGRSRGGRSRSSCRGGWRSVRATGIRTERSRAGGSETIPRRTAPAERP